MGISSVRSIAKERKNSFTRKSKFGQCFSKFVQDWINFTNWKSFTGIWSQRMSLSTKTGKSSLGTWMSLKSVICAWPRLELPIMRVHRFGRICRMISSLIFGLWDVCCMRWLHSVLPSRVLTWKICTRIFCWALLILFQIHIARIWSWWLTVCWRKHQWRDRQRPISLRTSSR